MMYGIEIIYELIHTFTPCSTLEQAYFISSLLCINPFSYIDLISSYSNCRSFTISRENDIKVTIYFGLVIQPDAIHIQLHDLSKIHVLHKRRTYVLSK